MAPLRESKQLPFATDEYSPIEEFIIEYPVRHQNIDRLLSYVPQLRRLSLDDASLRGTNTGRKSVLLHCLTHLYLKLNDTSFNDFELWIKNFFCSIEVLHLYVENGEQYLSAKRWKQLILSSMPSLRIFDIYICSRNTKSYDSQLDEFNSSFWSERKWYFAHQDYFDSYCQDYHTIFYSTNPYRYQLIY